MHEITAFQFLNCNNYLLVEYKTLQKNKQSVN